MVTARWCTRFGLSMLLTLAAAGASLAQQPSVGVPAPGLSPGLPGPAPDSVGQILPGILSDGRGRLFRFWVDEMGGRGQHIRFQRSADGGQSWLSEARTLDADEPAGASSTNPALVADASGHVLAIWRAEYAGGRKAIRFLRSDDGGATWAGPPRSLSQSPGALGGDLAADGQGHVYAVWYAEGPDTASVYRSARGTRLAFNRSEDFGKTWLDQEVPLTGPPPGTVATPPARPTPPPQPAPPAQEARAGDRSNAEDETTVDEERQRRPGGGRGGGRRRGGAGARVTGQNLARAVLSFQPRLYADAQGRVAVIWIDTREGRAEVYARASADHGKTWGPEVNVSRGAMDAIGHQMLGDGQGRVFVVWYDRRDGLGLEDVFFTRSEDGGKQWAAPARLSRRPVGATASLLPHMALDAAGTLYVAWADRRNGRDDIYLNVSADGGKSWLDRDIRLDRDDAGTGVSRNPHVVTRAAGDVAVVWDDDRTGFEQLLLNRSTDGGRSWLSREVRVDTAPPAKRRAVAPRAVWDSAGVLHVVWQVLGGAGAQLERGVTYSQVKP